METSIQLTWPPAYNLRLSRKARHAHIKVIPNQGLEVVIPARQHKSFDIAALLAQKKGWIEKHLATLKIRPLEYIDRFNLHSINQTWNIEYQQTLAKNIRAIIRPGNDTHTMILHGNVNNLALANRWLQAWLKEVAREHLLPWLYALSVEHDLPYNKAAIRAQQTLWGSCTTDKNISLNYKLLFIPRNHAEHVMLHELCHTKHLNHSKRFWNLLNRLDPATEMHNRAIREADQYVPVGF
ncbi:MAG TPA: SprT family zinc-dependent metalloprotease [Gammaproteobacteria bacterium]|nr:SprT family zinc-dependent metalloprotease [Gammaproteobacteria bacterium]